jgi:hypothetical protein
MIIKHIDEPTVEFITKGKLKVMRHAKSGKAIAVSYTEDGLK